MNILFLTIGRMDHISNQGIYTDLLRQFRANSHRIVVVCSREKRVNKPTEYLEEEGIDFIRVKVGNISKSNRFEKGLATITLQYLFLRAIKKYLKDIKFDLVIYSTPPITFGKVIKYIKNRYQAKSYLLLKDIFPQNAIDLRMIKKNSLMSQYFRVEEKKLYALSDYIGCMSQANVEYILSNNPQISSGNVEVCPNSIEPVKFVGKRDRIRMKYGIPNNRTVFIYGGNLGKPQGIPFLLECLIANKANPKVYFIIAGSGTEYNKLQLFIENKGLSSVQLFAQLPKNEYEELVNSCDVGLIFLDRRFTVPNFPSRLLSYMQAALPVLAATDGNTDLSKVIENGKFGFWCKSGDVEEFNRKVQVLCDEERLRKEMGVRARSYLENHYTVKHSYDIIMSHFM